MKRASIDVNKEMHVNLHIRVTGVKRAKVCIWLAAKLITWAGSLLGGAATLEIIREDAGEEHA